MSARRQLGAALKAGLPAAARYKVLPYPTNDPGPAARPVLIVFQDSVKPFPEAPEGTFQLDLVVWVLIDALNSKGEDVLETALNRTLDVIHAQDWLLFVEAERQSFGTTHTGYKIALTAAATRTKE